MSFGRVVGVCLHYANNSSRNWSCAVAPRGRRKLTSNRSINWPNIFRQPPDQLTNEQVRQYLFHLARERQLAPSSINQAVCALRFLYERVLHREVEALRQALPFTRKPILRPQVYSTRNWKWHGNTFPSNRTSRVQRLSSTAVYPAARRTTSQQSDACSRRPAGYTASS